MKRKPNKNTPEEGEIDDSSRVRPGPDLDRVWSYLGPILGPFLGFFKKKTRKKKKKSFGHGFKKEVLGFFEGTFGREMEGYLRGEDWRLHQGIGKTKEDQGDFARIQERVFLY
ncbi:hypothetical protein Ancab_040409 [Ancistrocladus abbreviatus]